MVATRFLENVCACAHACACVHAYACVFLCVCVWVHVCVGRGGVWLGECI